MTQMALPWWPRTTSSPTSCGSKTGATTTTNKSTKVEINETHHHHHHRSCCLSKFVRKLRKQSRTMLQCRSIGGCCGGRKVHCRGGYDPLSYSLNFDDTTRGCGGGDKNLLDEEDYYRFCAFTSRFVNSSTVGKVVPSTAPRLVLATATH